jgi:hypothetical protein
LQQFSPLLTCQELNHRGWAYAGGVIGQTDERLVLPRDGVRAKHGPEGESAGRDVEKLSRL